MKSLKLFLGAALGLGFIIGTSGMSFAGAVCLDAETICNDLKIYTTNDYSGKLVSVYGYEYGCGQPGRAFTGVLIKSSTTKQYILTGNWNNASQIVGGTYRLTKSQKLAQVILILVEVLPLTPTPWYPALRECTLRDSRLSKSQSLMHGRSNHGMLRLRRKFQHCIAKEFSISVSRKGRVRRLCPFVYFRISVIL